MEKIILGKAEAKKVLIQAVDEHDLAVIENEYKLITELVKEDICLIALKVDDWNDDLSPWQAEAVFGQKSFGGRASDTLEIVKSLCVDKDRKYYIGGYSLAGLFALWAAYQTELFEAVAAASPSVWFPSFTDMMREKTIGCDFVYLSLGDKEYKSRNPLMATVADRIIEAKDILESKGVACRFEWNEGNHFKDADIRTAKAFVAALQFKADT